MRDVYRGTNRGATVSRDGCGSNSSSRRRSGVTEQGSGIAGERLEGTRCDAMKKKQARRLESMSREAVRR